MKSICAVGLAPELNATAVVVSFPAAPVLISIFIAPLALATTRLSNSVFPTLTVKVCVEVVPLATADAVL